MSRAAAPDGCAGAFTNLGGRMCFKLDNGSELFSVQDMHRLRKKSSGVMGSRTWARGVASASPGMADGNETSGDTGSGMARSQREGKG